MEKELRKLVEGLAERMDNASALQMSSNLKTDKARGEASATAFGIAIYGINKILERERRRERRKNVKPKSN